MNTHISVLDEIRQADMENARTIVNDLKITENAIEIVSMIVMLILAIYITVLMSKKEKKVNIIKSVILNVLLIYCFRSIYNVGKELPNYSIAGEMGEPMEHYILRTSVWLIIPIIIQIVAIFIIKHNKK